ncbi:hypothetical protein DPMN_041430 [Dreissena polymorpha]|uniref:Uncharacterized protein n=1 Tax=Dreissena polymorpha TaxID=45954 RepID=A0A9D4CXS2_DREPO|nr:hypothetical protein DPMN_041430 [Dreissena polymorpha]
MKKLSSLRGEKKKQLLNEIFFHQIPSVSIGVSARKTKSEEYQDISTQSQVKYLNGTVMPLQAEVNTFKENSALKKENASLKDGKRRLKRQLPQHRS